MQEATQLREENTQMWGILKKYKREIVWTSDIQHKNKQAFEKM